MGSASRENSETPMRGFLHKFDEDFVAQDACYNNEAEGYVVVNTDFDGVVGNDVVTHAPVIGMNNFVQLSFTGSDVPTKTGIMHAIDTTNLKT